MRKVRTRRYWLRSSQLSQLLLPAHHQRRRYHLQNKKASSKSDKSKKAGLAPNDMWYLSRYLQCHPSTNKTHNPLLSYSACYLLPACPLPSPSITRPHHGPENRRFKSFFCKKNMPCSLEISSHRIEHSGLAPS